MNFLSKRVFVNIINVFRLLGTISLCTFSINSLDVGMEERSMFFLTMSFTHHLRSSYFVLEMPIVFIKAKHDKPKSAPSPVSFTLLDSHLSSTFGSKPLSLSKCSTTLFTLAHLTVLLVKSSKFFSFLGYRSKVLTTAMLVPIIGMAVLITIT